MKNLDKYVVRDVHQDTTAAESHAARGIPAPGHLVAPLQRGYPCIFARPPARSRARARGKSVAPSRMKMMYSRVDIPRNR